MTAAPRSTPAIPPAALGATAHEALYFGRPLVLAPARDDQGVFADRAVAAGSLGELAALHAA